MSTRRLRLRLDGDPASEAAHDDDELVEPADEVAICCCR
jgi:hypothetical protein